MLLLNHFYNKKTSMASQGFLLKTLCPFIVSVFLFSYICIPQSRIGNTAIYTCILYTLTIIALYLYYLSKSNKEINKGQVKDVTSIIWKFICISFIGFVIALFFDNTVFHVTSFLTSNFILLIYAFTFSVLCQYERIRKTMIVMIIFSSLIVGVYGIYCYFTETNPYIMYIILKYGDEGIVGGGEIGSSARGLSHRVAGNIGNPVYYGGVLLLLISFCFIEIQKRILSLFRYIVVLILVIALIFTGSRSSLGPILLFMVLYLYHKYKRRSLIIAAVFLFFLYLFLPVISQYVEIGDFLSSFDFSANRSDVRGSTFELRYSQLKGLTDIVGDNIFFGNGVGWVADYVAKYGHHPVLEGFESLIYSSFTDGGLWGVLLVYPFLFYELYKFTGRYSNYGKSFFPKLFILIYIIFSLLTGMYGVKMFIVFLLLIVNYTFDFEKKPIYKNM